MKNDRPNQNLYGFELPAADPLRVAQVADVLQCSAAHAHSLVAAKELPALNIAPANKLASWRIAREALEDFIARRTTGADGIDFQAAGNPHGLMLPVGRFLVSKQVAGFLNCSVQHVLHLVEAEELAATNIALTESCQKRPLIHRAALIHFINNRAEGAW